MKTSPLDAAVTVTRALGHPARLRTVAMLRTGELCVCQINEVLQLAASTVSAHLKELKQAGLTEEHKDGRWVHVRLADDPLARSWIETVLAVTDDDPQLAADSRLVTELRTIPVEDLCRLGYEGARAGACSDAAGEDSRQRPGGCE